MFNSFDIALIGSGMKGLLQLTKEAELAIDAAHTVFRLNNHPEVVDYLERKKPGNVRNLGEEYHAGERRDAIYERMAQRVLDEFRSTKQSVCLVTSGHPTYLVSPSQIIIRAAREAEIKVKVVAGLSSLDNIFADIGFDPGIRGFQSYEATDLVLRNVTLNPETPLFVWQPGAFQNFFYSTRKSTLNQFSLLKSYLGKFYPPTHSMYVLRTPTLIFTKPECRKISIGSLEELSNALSLLHILFVPPLDGQATYDEELVAKLEDPGHILELTEEWPQSPPTEIGRAQIIRDIMKRAYEDPGFCEYLRMSPEQALSEYELNECETQMLINSDERKIFDYLGNERQAFAREYGNYIENLRAAALKWNSDIRVVNS